MNIEVTVEVESRARLGEGPYWHEQKGLLYWVDIEGKQFHVYDPATGIDKTYETTMAIGAIVPDQHDGFIAAAENGFYKYNPVSGDMDAIAVIDGLEQGSRMNDGKCDPSGRFWAGTIGPENKAALYCLDTDLTLTEADQNITVSNGLTWDAEKNLMYYIDSATQMVVAYNYDADTGNISDKKKIISVPESMGVPDGMTIDEHGKLWIALWGGNAISRWEPETGKLMQKIDIPAKNVSSCAFGGKDLDTLYITSARTHVSEQDLKLYPLTGSLFSIKPGVCGLPMQVFKTKS